MSVRLEVKNLCKYYGKIKVLDDVNISINSGEILGLVGANGSGKSTLMNILFGNTKIDKSSGYEGTIYLDGDEFRSKNPKHAISKGVGLIHQEFMLIPDMSVNENIRLTRESTKNKSITGVKREYSQLDSRKNKEISQEVLQKLGVDMDTSCKVVNISVNGKQFIEIAREISREDLKLLLVDEPTAVLNEEDSKKLMIILKELADSGVSVIFSSHRLNEIKEISDQVVVLRDGQVVSTYYGEDIDVNKISFDMIGENLVIRNHDKIMASNDIILKVKDFHVEMPGEELRGLDLELKKREILGVSSLSGHGKLALGYGLMGMFPSKGSITYKGQDIDVHNVQKNIKNGMYLLVDDRKHLGLLMEHSVEENIIFTSLYLNKKSKGKELNAKAKTQIEMLDIKCQSGKQKVSDLSGGNQQKVCIARANLLKPELLIVQEPTRGVDIGAKEKILDMLMEMNRENGTTIIMISSEIEEMKRMCHRIAVVNEGKISEILTDDAKEIDFVRAYTKRVGDRNETN